MNAEITLTKSDWKSFQKLSEREASKRAPKGKFDFYITLISWIVIGISLVILFGTIHWPTAGLVTLIAVFSIGVGVLHLMRIKKAYAPIEGGMFIGRHRFTFDDSGITAEGDSYRSHFNWNAVQSVQETNDVVIVFLDTAYGLIFPKRDLEDPVGFAGYLRRMKTEA